MQASVRAFQPRQSLLILCLLSLFVGLGGKSWGQIISENFQSWTARSAYTPTYTQAGSGGTWTGTQNGVFPTGTASGTGSVGNVQFQAQTGILELPVIISGGAGTLTFAARVSSASTQGVTIEKKIGSSGAWTAVQSFTSDLTTTGKTFSVTINDNNSNLYLRFNTTAYSRAFYLHDVSVTAAASTLSPPTLIAATNATVDAPFDVTYTDNSSWRGAITDITIGGTSLMAGYSVSAGKITFTPSMSNPAGLLQTSGTNKAIVVKATGYSDATVSQTINSGAATKLAIATQPTAPASNGATLATQPVVNIADQYGNIVTTSAATVTAAKGAGTWTIGGTTAVNAVSGVTSYSGLTATSTAIVTGATIVFSSPGLTSATSNAFNIPAPAPTLTANPTSLNFGNVGVNTNSASQSVSISGLNLTGAPGSITISSSSNQFQLSLDNSSFSTANITIPYTSATLSATNIWVRSSPTQAGTRSGTLTISGGGASTTVSLSAFGVSIPVVSAATVSGNYGTTLSYNISASNSPTSYAISNGTLPSGLSLNTTSGLISGTPAVVVAGVQVGVTATNAGGTSSPATLTFNIATKSISYTGLSATSKIYDGTTTATLNGMAVLNNSDIVAGDNVTLTGTPTGTYANPSVAASKAVTVTGLSLTGPDAAKYTLTQPSINGAINAKPLTVTGVTANDKVYDGLIATTLSGTPVLTGGIISGDDVSVSSTNAAAKFADANAGTNKPVTVTGYALAGTSANNYSIIQPSGLTANITKANQTITFPPLPTKTTADADFDPGATTTAIGLTITYTSSNPAVATIVSGKIHTVGVGTSVITASQPGNGNYNAAADVQRTLTVTQGVFENFDADYTGTYNNGTPQILNLKSGSWTYLDALSGTTGNSDKVNSNPYSVRVEGTGSLYMNFDVSNGAKSVTIYHAAYSTNASATWKLQYSINGGNSWNDASSSITTSSSLAQAQIDLTSYNISGNVRFKILKLTGGTSNKINFDDFDYIGQDVSTPVFNSNLSSTRCQAAETVIYTATATNTTGITYSLDATSLAAGNTINALTGAVTYTSTWSGTSTITASAAGGSGPKTATFTVTTSVPATITSQPTVPSGTVYTSTANAATLSVTATGASGYQWQYYNGSAWQNVATGVPTGFSYSGGTTASLTINTGAQADTYPYRVLVSNGACSTASNTVNLVVTASAPPTVITSAPTSVTASGAIFNGSITTANGSTINGYGFYYGTSPNPGTTGQSIGSFSNPGTYPFSFSTTTMSGGNPVTLSGPNVLYYVQAFASVSAGQPGNGSVLTFYTLANVPNAPSISNITATTFDVTINPNNNPAGTAYVVRLVSGGNTYYLKADGSLSTTEVWITGTTITATGLTPVTAYTVSVKARNGDLVETAYSGTTIATTLNNPLTASYRSLTSGNFATASTWEYNSTGTTYVTATSAPSSANPVLIRHAVTLSASYSSAAGFTLTSDGAFTPSLIISPAGILSSTAGTVNFNGKPVTVRSTQDGTGAIGIMANAISGATAVTVERYTNGSLQQSESRRAWRLMTSPVSGQTIHQSWQENGVNDNTYGTLITGYNLPDAATAAMQGYDFTGAYFNTSIKHYVPASNAWVPLSSDGSTTGTNIPVRNEQAYMVYVRGDRTITTAGSSNATLRATGTLQQGTQPAIPLSAGSYTLVGNPYASSIDFASLYSNNTGAILNQFYLWNSKLGTYGAYAFVSRNAANTAYVVTPGTLSTSNNDAYRYIPSGSGFFVTPRTSPSVTSITIREADKAAGSIPPISPFRVIPVATNVRELLVNLNLRDSDTSATLADGFRALFSNDYEGNEKDNSNAKAFNFNENLGLVREQDSLIIEARANVRKTDTLHMKLWNVTKRAYQFQVKAANFTNAPGIRAWLEDSYLATKQELGLNGDITTVNFDVSTDAASASSDRFRIVFENNTAVLPVTITKVSAQPKSGGAEVNWTVANETNIKGYTVEKSNDGGRTFSGMGTQQAAHNNPQAALTVYSGYDAAPQTGDNYYRIRIEAKDGTISYSDIVKVTIGANGTGIQITLYPNPVREGKANLQMTNLAAGTYLVSVYTGSGQTVYQRKITIAQPNTTQSEQLLLGNSIAQGSYRIKLSDSKGKLMKEQSFIVAK